MSPKTTTPEETKLSEGKDSEETYGRGDSRNSSENESKSDKVLEELNLDFDIPITHGDVVSFRDSTFQAHVAPVTSPEEIKYVLDKLKRLEPWDICSCRPCAFRVQTLMQLEGENPEVVQSIVQECHDGEDFGAGEKLLNLLCQLHQRSILQQATVTIVTGGGIN